MTRKCTCSILLHEKEECLELPRSEKQASAQAFSHLRKRHHFSEYDLHAFAKTARSVWIADHIDSTMAQTLASRAYHAVNRVCLSRGKRVRFRSQGRGLDCVEGKKNDVGLRFVLDPNAGDGGFLLWQAEVIPAIIDWLDPVVQHGLRHRIKYVRLVRRTASSPRAQGADHDGNRYCVQLVLEGHAFIKKKHEHNGTDTIGLDIGPSTVAMVPREGKAALMTFCEDLTPFPRQKRRLQRQMDRQRRATNPDHYDEQGRVKKGNNRLIWKESQRSQSTRRHLRNAERRLAAHRKSLHGHLAHSIVKMGTTITLEKTSFKGWQKLYGKSIGLRAPGMFLAHLERLVARTGGTLTHISTFTTRLSQYCHQCGCYEKKPLWQRWHSCRCGVGPVQRDLYSAFLLAYLEPEQTIPSITHAVWEGAEPRLRVVMEGLQQRANEGHTLPRSMGILAVQAARARARRLESPPYSQQEPLPLSSASAQGESGNVG